MVETDTVQNKTDEICSITGRKLMGKIETGSSSSNTHLNFPLQETITNWIDELLGEGALLQIFYLGMATHSNT